MLPINAFDAHCAVSGFVFVSVTPVEPEVPPAPVESVAPVESEASPAPSNPFVNT